MRKIFTLIAAVLASIAINADVTYSFELDSTVHKDANVAYSVNGGKVTFGNASKFETKADYYMYKLDGDPKSDNTKYALVELDEAVIEGAVITISGLIASNPSDGQAFLLTDDRAATTKYAVLKPDGSKNTLLNVSYTVKAGDAIIGQKAIYISRDSKTVYLQGVSIDMPVSTDPVLTVDVTEIALHATAAKPNPSAVVKFSGRHLAAGNYALSVPNVAGLTVDPASVTVGADGQLNAEVTIAFASDVDVEAANTSISLTIGELSKSVTVNYSANLNKEFMTSINIEQLVLDNGKKFDIEAALNAAHIEFADINELDSLNDGKDARNEPYLGLKLKKQGAKVAGWLKAGSSIAVKFGNVGCDLKIGVNGEYQTLLKADAHQKELHRTAGDVDEYLEIIATNEKTVVLKQIMIDEEIAKVELPEAPQTALDNINAEAKAVKVVRNGMLLIEKNGEVFNVLGTRVR